MPRPRFRYFKMARKKMRNYAGSRGASRAHGGYEETLLLLQQP